MRQREVVRRAGRPLSMLLASALCACVPGLDKEPAEPLSAREQLIQRCVDLRRKADLWCRDTGLEPTGQAGGFDCLDARIRLKRLCY